MVLGITGVLKTLYTVSPIARGVVAATSESNNKKKEEADAKASEPLNVRIYTHNIRYDNGALWEGEKPWSERKYPVASSMEFHSKGTNLVVTLQEVLHNQVEDLQSLLGESWSYYGIGREDGITRGEYSPIFWKNTQWNLLDSRTFWLSETPDRPSKGWDANLERIVGWVYLENKETGARINVFSTHFDDQGVVARRESTKLIISKTKDINNDPCFLGGDFNTEPSDEPYHVASQSLLDASKQVTNEVGLFGHYKSYTYTGFDGGIKERAKVIDYIWCEKKQKQLEKGYNLIVVGYGILHSEYNGFYMSDHRPVVADIKLEYLKEEAMDKDYVILFKPKQSQQKKVL